MEGGIKMKEQFIVNTYLLDYLMKNIRLISECDIQEKVHKFPYTRSVSNFFQKLSYEYDIDFDEELISEELLSKMIDEIEENLPR
jgi:very-short-patch-repair endonuclease